MKSKWLLLSGVLAATVYVVPVILGGALRPGYSHLAEPISELTAAGAPNKGLLDIFFITYNILVVVFGAGLFQKASSDPAGKLSGRIAGLWLMAAGICGVLLQLFFPQDPGGARAPVTTTGTMHVAIAGLAALTSMLGLLFSALWFRKLRELKGYVVYTLITLAVMVVSGGYGAAAAAGDGNPLFGLIERITIGAMVQWLLVVSLKLYAVATAEGREAETLNPSRHPAGD